MGHVALTGWTWFIWRMLSALVSCVSGVRIIVHDELKRLIDNRIYIHKITVAKLKNAPKYSSKTFIKATLMICGIIAFFYPLA